MDSDGWRDTQKADSAPFVKLAWTKENAEKLAAELRSLVAERDYLRLESNELQAERDRLMVENDSLREIAESWRRIKAERDQLRSLLVEINREAYDTTSGNVSHRTSPGQPWRDLP